MSNFQAGQISQYYNKWTELTSDQEILQTVHSEVINSVDAPPDQKGHNYSNYIGKDHPDAVEQEIQSLVKKRVVVPSPHENGEYISPPFHGQSHMARPI